MAETAPLSISRVGTPQKIDGCSTPDDSAAQGSPARPADAAVAAPAFDLIESAFRIGDRRIEVRNPAAALSLTADQLARRLAASHPSNADKPVGPRVAAGVDASLSPSLLNE